MLSLASNLSTVLLTIAAVVGFGIKVLNKVGQIVSTLETLVKTVAGHGGKLDKFEQRLIKVEKTLGIDDGKSAPPSA